jgi:hypothetical protein
MQYNYLTCDGPNCERKQELINTPPADDQGAGYQPDGGQVDTSQTSPGAQMASNPDEQPVSNDEPAWLTLDTGAQIFNFCSYDCLASFVKDPDSSAASAYTRYQEFFGYES